MKTSEVRKFIAESQSSSWFNELEISINYPSVGFQQTFKGLSSFHKFIEQQVSGWDELGNEIPSVLNNAKNHFSQLKNSLDGFIQSRSSQDTNNLQSWWNQQRNSLQKSSSDLFTFDSAETKFLISMEATSAKNTQGAYNFLIGSNAATNNLDNFIGALLAYEFRRVEYPKLRYRKLGEADSFKELIANFREQISEGERQLTEYLAEAVKNYKEYVSRIDGFKEEKESLFNTWFDESKDKHDEFTNTAIETIKDLEDTYEKKLQLAKPAEYWDTLSKKHRTQGWIAFGCLSVFVVIVICLLAKLLLETPEGIYANFFQENKGSAIRWSIGFITFISFMAFLVRAISKVMFSSFHLSRDCQERHTLTYFYLALQKDTAISSEEKQLIMQSLFSRADTGLLKDDGSPSMPNDITGKLFGK